MTIPGNLSQQQQSPDPVLTNVAIAGMTGGPFIADDLFPVVTQTAEYGKIAIYGQEAITDDVDTERAIGAEPHKTTQSKTWDFYVMKEHSLDEELPNELIGQASNTDAPKTRATLNNTNKLRIGIEKRVRAYFAATANSSTAAVKWDAANPTIIPDVDAEKYNFMLQYGVFPNTVVVPWNIASIISNDKETLERLKYTMSTLVTEGDLPDKFRNMRVLVPGAIVKNSALAALAPIWAGPEIFFAYVESATGQTTDVNTCGLQIRATNSGGGLPVVSWEWPHPHQSKNTTVITTMFKQAEKVTNAKLMRRFRVMT